jgi:transcription elongation GreA/GreB family factor
MKLVRTCDTGLKYGQHPSPADRSIGEPLEARVCCPAMSRAFVKDADEVEELPDRPISDHPNEVTREGLHQIEAALSAAQEIYAAAQATGDREGLSGAGRDLRYWTARRSSAVVAPEPHDNSVVRFGHTVTIVRDDGREQTFRIVGEDEADPARGNDLAGFSSGASAVRKGRR